MSHTQFEKQLLQLGERRESVKLQELINRTSIRELTKLLDAKLGRNEFIMFWDYLLQGFDLSNYEACEKRFACVKFFLDGLQKVELSYKQMSDLTMRLCQHLASFESEQLIEILEKCIDGVRAADPKCDSWKDLLPATLDILAARREFKVNGITMSGAQFRDTTVNNLCTMRWQKSILTPMATMFKDLQLTNAEKLTVLNKFAGALQDLSPMELPALAIHLFSMCNSAAQIVIPLLALEKYFHRYYYKKLFSDMCSNSTDFDSIDAYSDKELREAEETILHYLDLSTQYKFNEIQLQIVFRNFVTMPDVILTPFMLSAIITMTAANRNPEVLRLSKTILLPFLRTVIKNNEEERKLAEYSVWCRDTLQRKQIDLEQVFTVLIDRNKEGKDVITPGLVNLAFLLLKSKQNSMLNSLAIAFLVKFIRKRFVFGKGIVEHIAEWMIVEQDQYQYSECLTMLSVADTFTVSECIKSIKYVLDFFLWLPGEQAMRMMSFILPLLKLSNIVRDALIEVLREAMYSGETRTCRMGVYGFCMILKQLNNSNSQRMQMNASGYCTQHSISGFSLNTQSVLSNRSNPQRNFDMLTLEIIGLLRNCFIQNLDIKRTLYENLQRAVELNPKLAPHVLQFIDWHFRDYFHAPAEQTEIDDETATQFSIKYEKLVCAKDAHHMELEIKDNLGCLIHFVAQCLTIYEKLEADYDTCEMKRLLNSCIEKIITKQLQFEDTSGPATHLKCALLQQQLNIIEGLITYVLNNSKQTNDVIKQILPLFKAHSKLYDGLKSLSNSAKKAGKRAKNPNDNEDTTCGNLTINGLSVKKINTEAENIWDLAVIEKLLRLLHEDIVPFAAPEHTTILRSNANLVCYVLEIAAHKVEAVRLEPDYKQLAHSKRVLKNLTDITKVVYERCIKCLPTLWRDFDMAAASKAACCFMQCLKTANETYKKRFKDFFVKGFDFYVISQSKEAPYVLQNIIDEFMQEDASAQQPEDELCNNNIACLIPQMLLQCLEVLYDNIDFENRITSQSYSWLLHFCQTYKLQNDNLGLVHKLLFTQRQKTHSGAFFNGIALLLGKVLGVVNEEMDESNVSKDKQDLQLKSLTMGTALSCLQHLHAAVTKQVDDVDYFIEKANNLNYKCRIVSDDDRTFHRANLDSLQRAICTQLIHISNTLLELSNVCIPLGSAMDSVIRLIIHNYNCLSNYAKHIISCCANDDFSIRSTKFDLLLRVVGKPLSRSIYALYKYIEENVLDDKPRKRINGQADKAKVLRGTKLLPKIVSALETFNKHVITLSKKTDNRLANLLHLGTMRDFRIKNDDLVAAIERSHSHSKEIKATNSDLVEENNENVAGAEDDLTTTLENTKVDEDANENSTAAAKAKKPKRNKSNRIQQRIQSCDTDVVDENQMNDEASNQSGTSAESRDNANKPTSSTQLLKNLAKINQKSKKRALRESELQSDPDVLCAVVAQAPVAKRRRGRSAAEKK